MKECANTIYLQARLTAFIVLIFVGAAQATLCQIRVRPTACPKAGAVRLADVADITAENAEIKERLANIVVVQLPRQLNSRPGGTLQDDKATSDIVVSLFDISRAIARSGINPATIDIFGASTCRLIPDKAALAEAGAQSQSARQKTHSKPDDNTENAEIEAAVEKSKNTIADQIIRKIILSTRLDPVRLVVDWNKRDEQFLQQEFDKKRYRIEPRSPVTLGRVSFAIVDMAPNTSTQSSTKTRPRGVIKSSVRNVVANVGYLCEAVVAVNPLPANHVITAEDVRVDINRISNLRDMTPADLDTIIGKKTARAIAVNKVIEPSLIKKIFLVKRNDYVKVNSQAGSISITLRGKAMADGGLGDTISIAKDNCKNNVVRAVVTGPGTVRTITSDKQAMKVATVATAATIPTEKLGTYKTPAGLMRPVSDFGGSISKTAWAEAHPTRK
jgi:flagella basal body P-ring formation protein FlgA